MQWNDAQVMACDFETSGTLPEYALQPWRVATGAMWATVFVGVRKYEDMVQWHGGVLDPYSPKRIKPMLKAFLDEAVATKAAI